jgi:hypothetical protein
VPVARINGHNVGPTPSDLVVLPLMLPPLNSKFEPPGPWTSRTPSSSNMDWRTDLGAGTLVEGPVHHLNAPFVRDRPPALSNTDPVAPTSGASTLPVPVTSIVPQLIKTDFAPSPKVPPAASI